MANPNSMSINKMDSVLNAIVAQATGRDDLASYNNDFTSVAQIALRTGYDPICNSISQVLSDTIFSVRPYTRRFNSIRVDSQRWGNHVRKLQTLDSDFENDARLDLIDGESIDQYTVNKPPVMQTNIYGSNTFQRSLTLYKDQLDTAFSGPNELNQFVTMVMTNASDQIEQAQETAARAALCNLIAAVYEEGNSSQKVHLITEYNAFSGLSLTPETVNEPGNFEPFIRWLYARLQNLSDFMEERSELYHFTTFGGDYTDVRLSRHTPKADQRLFMLSSYLREMETLVSSVTYHDEKLVLPNHEGLTFWQSIKTPDTMSLQPTHLSSTGGYEQRDVVTLGNCLGVLFDREAIGVTTVNEWSQSSPFNAKGGYSNMFWHFTERYWNDFSENCVVLLLD